MINWFLLPFFFVVISCVPQESAINLGSQTEGGVVAPNPTISSLEAVGTELIINGYNFGGVTEVTIKGPSSSGTFEKPFKVLSANLSQLISQSIDATSLPVGVVMELIFSNAYGQTSYPITFTLEPNAVKTVNILNGNVTPAKLQGSPIPPSSPPSGGADTVLKWDVALSKFYFGSDAGSGGTAGVTSITLGEGIQNQGAIITSSGVVAVDTGVRGETGFSVIPFFDSSNKIVMDSTGLSPNFSGLQFKDGTNFFNMFNENSLKIRPNGGGDLFTLNYNGDLSIEGNITADGSTVCTTANGACSSSSVNQITATPPVVVSSPTGNINISLNTSAVVTSISAQPGINVTSNSPTAGNVQIGADFGPPAGTEITVQKWFKNLDDVGSLIPNNNAVIIGDGSSFQVSSGDSLLLRINAQKADTDLTAIGNLTPSIGSIIVGGNTNVWTRQTIPNCGPNYAVLADTTFNPLGPFLTCSNVGSFINFGNIATNSQSGVTLNPNAGVPGELRFMEGLVSPINYVGFKAPASVNINTIWTLPPADATTTGAALTSNSGGILSWSTNTIGDVVGPSGSTDNAIARFDLATGRTIQNSGVLLDDSNSVSGVANFTAKGVNTNTPAALTSAIDFMTGRMSTGALAVGQTTGDLAFEYGGNGGGWRHYLTTTHVGANSNQNSFRFYLNNSVIVAGSSTPGTGNTLAMSVTAIGVGIMTASPTEALYVSGNSVVTNQMRFLETGASPNEYVGFKAPAAVSTSTIWTLPAGDGTSGQALTTDGSGVLSWRIPVPAVNAQNGTSYTLTNADCGNNVSLNNGAAITLNLPPLTIGCTINVTQSGVGTVTVNGTGGMTPQNAFGLLRTRTQYSVISIQVLSATSSVISGDVN